MKVDVLVVGGGPAGSAAAITLARAGRRVVLVEKARFPRDKCCGDGLTTMALRRLEGIGIRPENIPSWQFADQLLLRSAGGRTARYAFPATGWFAATARRRDLDAALADLAANAGAHILDGHAFEAAHARTSSWVVEVAGSSAIEASYIVGADGMWSPLRRSLFGSIGYRGEWVAMRQYVAEVGPEARSRLAIWIERDLRPGYAWSFPVSGGYANVGLGVPRDTPAPALATLWSALLERPHIRSFLGETARSAESPRAWPVPTRLGATPLCGPRALFVGDAAAVVDPLTGEGIAQAIGTGVRAGEAIIACGGDVAATSQRYRESVYRDLAADHKVARVVAALVRRRGVTGGTVAITAANSRVATQFARWLFEDYPRGLLATPRRWRRGSFGGQGAYVRYGEIKVVE